ncbi:riboflavin kinase [Patescibacteria group bacterium]|nr:riboflavin kinase [Patescibacteria group bacterium]
MTPILLKGTVVRGRGLRLRFPTATLQVSYQSSQEIAEGVYASRMLVDGVSREAVTSVGVAVSVGAAESTVETNLLDFTGDLVGKEVELELVAFLRPMEHFSSLEELEEAIARDREQGRRILESI